jgi:hypothetical protein
MNSNLILRLVDLAVSLAEQDIGNGSTAGILLDIIQKAVEVYEEQTGRALNTDFIEAEEELT